MKTIHVSCLLLLALAVSSEASFWDRRISCGVSLWSDWSAWSGTGPSAERTRTRSVVREQRNGGDPCPELSQTTSRSGESAWSRQNVPKKFHNKFMTGHTHYYRFVPDASAPDASLPDGAMGLAGSSAGGGGDGLTLLPRDLLFIIDMSGSIASRDWTVTKQKLADLIARLCGTIGSGRQNNRIAIITFSNRIVLNFNFKTHWSISSVRRAILAMPQAGGTTCTGDAFDYAHRYMFEPNTGIRSATESVKEVLVLTDGESNCGSNLKVAVRRLQVKAFVFALAIGTYDSDGRAEIESMVSRPLIDHIFSLANFFEFREMVDIILQYPGKCAPFEL